MRVYLDNCCFNRPYDTQSQMRISLETQAKLYIQDLIKNKELELVTSYMLRFENEQNPYEMRRQAIIAGCDCFLTTDIRLLKYRTDRIVIEDPIDFIQRWEGEQNG